MSGYKANVSVCLMIMRGEDVLLYRRANTGYECGKYEFPSGHIEEKETAPIGVTREAKEETGLNISPNDVTYVCCVDNNTSGKHFNLLFMTDKFVGEPQLMSGEESDDFVWRSRKSLYENMSDLSIDTIRFLDTLQKGLVFNSYDGSEILFPQHKL